MGRPRKHDDAMRQKIIQARGTGTAAEVAGRFTAAGIDVSERTVRTLWQAAPPQPPTLDPDVLTSDEAEPPDADVLPALRRTAQAEERLARQARAAGRFDDAKKHTETYLKCISLLDKLTPVRPPDPNDNPDIRIAAERLREKMHDLLERRLNDPNR